MLQALWSHRSFVVLTAAIMLLAFFSARWVFLSMTPPPPKENAEYKDSTLPASVRALDLLSYMSLEEKVGQMALVEKNSVASSNDIVAYGLGGLLSGSGARPVDNSFSGWRTMIDDYMDTARSSRLGIPLLYGVDAVHGHAHVPGATIFPHAIGLGAAADPALVEAIGRATARELSATSINWNYAPTLDLPRDIRWGRVYESFSDDAELAGILGAAYVRGLQGANTAGEEKVVLATLKHYIGLGSMQWDTSSNKNFRIDQGLTVADDAALRSDYLPAFATGVAAGAGSVMVGLNTWGKKKLAAESYLITDVLKGELGFKGFVVSDWYGVYEIPGPRFFATAEAVNAGVDMVMLPFDYKAFTRHMKIAVWLGLVSQARVDDAVVRILEAKFALGLFDDREVPVSYDEVAHSNLARTAVAASQVLLKNDNSLLPLSSNTRHIRVVGSAANNVGMQAGAWTVEWQGVDGNWLPNTTSILAGIKEAVAPGVIVEYDERGEFAPGSKRAPVGIAVVGERPYAEGWGDKEYPMLDEADREAIKKLQASTEQVVVVIVSGRPLFISNEIDSWDGLVAAWLPGGEGAGVADVLFGKVPFTGTLPLPWPRHAEQLPLTADGVTADGTPILFPRFYSLR
ncbi:glycoside hydrolase family 3 protein [Patescibacteria group bacterium]|nr:glycoside hydrolase family 3 protein [Patescibacteria group bacterium]